MINLINGPIGDFFSKIGDILLYGLIAIIVIVSALLIRNSFQISVSERTKEFGMLASIGASKKQ